ncbi:MAG: RNA methyltransferase [Oscillospiraceae bacterium]|nr:RNA methyltransferase [Oscillospiraceae bacterium]
MELITSRKNARIRHFRSLASDRAYRREQGEFLCDGIKLLREALQFGAEVTHVLTTENTAGELPAGVQASLIDRELLRYVSPLENSPGPVFSVRQNSKALPERPERVMVLENVQDPGNVGTVLRTAAAFGMDLVLLCGECADPYNPKTVRSTMGAMFRQRFALIERRELPALLADWELPLYGAALSDRARDIGDYSLSRCAVAVGNEGHGLSRELLELCTGELIIPMAPDSESLNAAVAASVIMWEMKKQSGR